MILTQIRTQIYKDSFALTYPLGYQYLNGIPMVGALIPLFIFDYWYPRIDLYTLIITCSFVAVCLATFEINIAKMFTWCWESDIDICKILCFQVDGNWLRFYHHNCRPTFPRLSFSSFSNCYPGCYCFCQRHKVSQRRAKLCDLRRRNISILLYSTCFWEWLFLAQSSQASAASKLSSTRVRSP